MDIVGSYKPLLAISVSLIAALFIFFSGEKSRNLREVWTILAAVIKFTIVASMVHDVIDGKILEYTLASIEPGLSIQFRVDAFGLMFALIASFLWIITSFYSIGYMRTLNENAQTRYFVCFAIALSAAMGVAFSSNMFTTFLFYEIITICTYPLVAHKETPEAMQGARKYLAYLLGTSVGFQLIAIIITYSISGTTDFSSKGIFTELRSQVSNTFLTIVFFLYMAGVAKAAIMPFHAWLPAAMVAPTPVSALLHAVAVVKAGVFVALRIVLYVFGIDILSELGLGMVLTCFASFTILAASIIALRQNNLKARLAYSTVSQLSYIILGASLLSPSAITGSILHIALHAFGKITLFFTAGAIYVATHKTNISELNGIGKQMPFTMTAFTLGALSMIGIPPMGGFLSKWYIILGSIEADLIPVIILLAGSALLNAAYFLPIVYAAFFNEPQDHHNNKGGKGNINEAPALMVVPLLLTAMGTLVLFFTPSTFLHLAIKVATLVTGN